MPPEWKHWKRLAALVALSRTPWGRYRHWKRLSKQFVPIDVTVYLLSVEDERAIWGEAATRRRAWLSPVEVAALVDEPELASMIGSLKVPEMGQVAD